MKVGGRIYHLGTHDTPEEAAQVGHLWRLGPNGYGGSDDITVRLHGTLIASQDIGGYGTTEVYQGEDGKIYVHDFQGELHHDVEPDELRDIVDEATYIQAVRALGEEVVIDVGLTE